VRILLLLRDVARGLAYLHANNVCHADLKVGRRCAVPPAGRRGPGGGAGPRALCLGARVGAPRARAERAAACAHLARAHKHTHTPTHLHSYSRVPRPTLPPKAENVLVAYDANADGGLVGKLGDFGLSRALSAHQTHASTRTVGTVTHM
jgi:serine/threonine protein kinase